MIDEKKVIEALEMEMRKEHTKCQEMCDAGLADSVVKYSHGEYCYMAAIHIVQQFSQPNVPDTKEGQWISCSEMLPPIDMSYPNAKNYLVYYEHGYYDVASYSNINRFWYEHTTEPYWNCQQYCKVVAWMPLPPAFIESEE